VETRDFSTRRRRVVLPATVAIALFFTTSPNDPARSHPVVTLASTAFAQNLSVPNPQVTPAPVKPTTLEAQPVEKKSSASATARAAAYGQLPLAFERNVGQTDARVQFLSRGNGYTVFLTDDAAVLSLQKSAPRTAGGPKADRPTAARSSVAVRLEFVGANSNTLIEPSEPLSSVTNYFNGDDPSQWHTGVPNYARVRQRDLYPGIDIVYYGNQRQLEYDFVVAPGADPGVIALNIAGANALEVDSSGNLVVDLPDGQMALKKPFAYQEADGPGDAVREIAVAYVIDDTREVRFAAAEYDHDKTLIIDPVLVYGTYLGGTGFDSATGLAIDDAGNAYVSGVTGSVDFPTTPGAHQSAFAGGTGEILGLPTDVFVAKLNAAGSALIYSTYLGGSNDDFGFGLAVDAAGNAFVNGATTSTNFPTTAGAYQTTFGGGADVFVAKLNVSGGVLYSTYIGGGCIEVGWSVAIDASGSAYAVGNSQVADGCAQTYPITAGAFQSTHGTEGEDVIVTKLNPAGSALVYSTFLAGVVTGGPHEMPDDLATGIAIDASGNAYIVGATFTSDFPTTAGAFRTELSNGGTCLASFNAGESCSDAFVAKLNSTGTALLYSTLIGGSEGEEANGIAIDADGNAYVTGYAESPNFPTTAGAYQTTQNGSGTDVFVVKFNPTGSTLLHSTLLGGGTGVSGSHNDSETASDIALDGSGNVYVVGRTRSSDFPTTPDALQPTYANGSSGGFSCENGHCDGFFTKLNPDLSALAYSTYLGGSGDDGAGAIRLDAVGNVYISGTTSSSNFPTTFGALQTALPAGGVSGQWDGPAESNLDCGDCHITLSLQRNGTTVTGAFGEGGFQGVQTSESGGIFTYDVTSPITDAPMDCVDPGMSGTMTVNTNSNTLDASWSGTNSDCLFETDTWALEKIGELGSGFLVKLNMALPGATGDYDGDGLGELVVYRPGTGTWYQLNSSAGFTTSSTTAFGLNGDVPVPGDYDGDGVTDHAVYRPAEGTWYVLQSNTDSVVTRTLGLIGDLPMPSDYDGDGKIDPTVYRPSDGTWHMLVSGGGYGTAVPRQWGIRGDLPVPGNYDDDNKADIAVYRPSTGRWYVLTSTSSGTASREFQWGLSGDVPVPGDYDGDGTTDVAVFRPATGVWFILQSESNFTTSASFQWGLTGDVPVPGEYDGDGIIDLAVFRPSDGTWYIAQSTTSYSTSVSYQWGVGGDIPTPNGPIAHAFAVRSTLATLVRSSDFDADRKADLTVYRPSNGTWYSSRSSTNFGTSTSYQWGLNNDVPVSHDYDGDGQTDAAVYRPSTGFWHILRSSSGYTASASHQFGLAGDLSAPGDYDGDALSDPAVFRPSTGFWHVLHSSTNYTTSATYEWGVSGDIPIPGDYDGDAISDLAVFRPSDGTWFIRHSTTGYATSASYQWGLPGDIAVPGEYDGDGKTDLAVYRPANGVWYVLQSSTNFTGFVQYQWGLSDDAPVPADFDGDRKTDLAVWRPSTGTWYLLRSSTGFTSFDAVQWGLPGDIPILTRP
jgi:hypothetical protein